MTIYISGPMSGDPDYNQKFDDAERKLRDTGCVVINPANHPAGLTYAAYMRLSMVEVEISDALYMLSGWEASPGARAEWSYAEALDKIIMYGEGKAPECESCKIKADDNTMEVNR